MDYKKVSDAIRLCGSTPKIHECKEKCPYYAGGDMMKCIPMMTKDAADAIIGLFNKYDNECVLNEQGDISFKSIKQELESVKKERDKAVEMVHKLADELGTCTGCKRLKKECSEVYICECDGEDHWEWEGLDEKSN